MTPLERWIYALGEGGELGHWSRVEALLILIFGVLVFILMAVWWRTTER